MSSTFRPRVSFVCLAVMLAGCAQLQSLTGKPAESTPSSTASTTAGTRPSAEANADAAGDDQPDRYAKESFDKCATAFDAAYARWKPTDEKAKKAITASASDTFYAGYGKLVGQFSETCKNARLLSRDSSAEDQRAFEVFAKVDGRGTALELGLAAVRLQIRNKVFLSTPIADGNYEHIWEVAKKLPFTGDASFDRNEYCGGGEYNARLGWLPKAERVAFLAKRKGLVAQQEALMKQLAEGLETVRLKARSDRGRVKAVKKLPDGSLEVSVKNLYGGSVCNHTGNYTFNGTFWSDCSYSGAVEKEIYPFSARFPAGNLPPTGVNVGDVVSLTGVRTPGTNERDAADGARYDEPYVSSIERGGKMVWDAPLSRMRCN